MKRSVATAIAIFMLASLKLAGAQPYPTKVITLVVPFAAGGSTDMLARTVAAPLSSILGQPIVIENRAGGDGRLGMTTVERSSPDGYTLLLAREGIPVPEDLVPVALIATQPLVLATRGSDLTTVAKFVEVARNKGVKYTSTGGPTGHAVGELCRSSAGVSAEKMTFVPMRTASDAMAALKSGSIDAVLEPQNSLYPLISVGDALPIAVAAPDRLPMLKDVPTTAEAGLANCSATVWFALLAPKGTPDEIIRRLHDDVTKRVLTRPEVNEFMGKAGMVMASVPLERSLAIIQTPPACCKAKTCPDDPKCK